VYENDEPNEVDTLVYAEDLSQNGTYWNGAFMGKGNGGFLLSDKDVLRLSRRTYLHFTCPTAAASEQDNTNCFDLTQEKEMAVRRNRFVCLLVFC
jgi:protein-serine/threonine kinase